MGKVKKNKGDKKKPVEESKAKVEKKPEEPEPQVEEKKPVKGSKEKPVGKQEKKPEDKLEPPPTEAALEKPEDSESEDENDNTNEREKIPYDKEDEPKTIFVGNLPINTKKSQIKAHFLKYGTIKTIRLRTHLGTKFFKKSDVKNDPYITAYVVYDKQESAIAAQEESGKKFREAHLRVTMATGKKGFYDGKRTIFVGNLKYGVLDEDLFEVFQNCGEIQYVRTIRSKLGCIGTGYVCFKNPSSLTLAKELNGTMVKDRPIRVEPYKAKLKQNKPEEQKKPKEITKFINGKPVKIKVKPDKVKENQKGKKNKDSPKFKNRNNALKRLDKKPGAGGGNKKEQKFNSDKPKSIGQKIQNRRFDPSKKKPKNKHRSTQSMKLAKKLNPNWKKPKTFNKPKTN